MTGVMTQAGPGLIDLTIPAVEPRSGSTPATPSTRITAEPPSDCHPLIAALDQLDTVIAGMADQADAWAGLDPATVRAACARIRRAKAAMDGHLTCATGVLEAAGTARRYGATSTGALLGRDFGGDRQSGDRAVRTGQRIERTKADATRAALVEGKITRVQADIITVGLSKLPKDVEQTERKVCERELLRQARDLSLGDLRRAADRASEPVRPPETVDQVENQTVEARERAAWARSELVMTDQHDGTTTGRFVIPTAQAMMLTTLIHAHSSPRRNHLRDDAPAGASAPIRATGRVEREPDTGRDAGLGGHLLDQTEDLTFAQRAGRALCAIIEHVPTQGYATNGGTPATLMVTLDLDTLTDTVNEKVAALPGSVTMSPSQARRLACSHGILPAVLDGASLPLDLGRAKRLFTPAQRAALALRDQGCAFPGCDRPPGWCEAHHIRPVSTDGPTDLANGILLCSRHHHTVHDQRWAIRLEPGTGRPQFQPEGSSRWHTTARYRPSRT